MKIRTVSLWTVLLACGLPAYAQSFQLDPAHTQVEFSLGSVLHTVHGTFQLKRGNIRLDGGKVSGEIVVDATSGASGNEARDRKMHSTVIESGRYPEIVFTPDKMEGTLPKQGKATLQMSGGFRVHGADHRITIPVEVEVAGAEYTATLHFAVPFIEWGMKNPSTFVLRVSDKVDITIKTTVKAGTQSNSASSNSAAAGLEKLAQ